MSVFNLKSTIRINCAKRCGIYLREEVEALGYKIDQASDSSVELSGTLNDCMRLNLYLRTAYRVLFLLDEFEAETPDQLYDQLVSFPWEEYVMENGYISISSFVENIHIRDTRFANLKVKDAVVDRMIQKTGQRPDSGSDTDKMVLYLYWKNNDAAIFIDTSGETIAKHGYRSRGVKAPMQEALAASVVLATRWDGKTAFINPMCGSGTIAIEAALIASNKAPGLMRQNFGFCHINGFSPEAWKTMRTEAARKIIRNPQVKIIATDFDPKAIQAAEANARSARMDHMIQFETCNFEQTHIPHNQKGVVVLNPEYGERMGDEEQLESIYGKMGDFFKTQCNGYTGYIFTGNLDLAKKVGLKARRRIEFFNGKIDCRLLEYELYEGSLRTPKSL